MVEGVSIKFKNKVDILEVTWIRVQKSRFYGQLPTFSSPTVGLQSLAPELAERGLSVTD